MESKAVEGKPHSAANQPPDLDNFFDFSDPWYLYVQHRNMMEIMEIKIHWKQWSMMFLADGIIFLILRG